MKFPPFFTIAGRPVPTRLLLHYARVINDTSVLRVKAHSDILQSVGLDLNMHGICGEFNEALGKTMDSLIQSPLYLHFHADAVEAFKPFMDSSGNLRMCGLCRIIVPPEKPDHFKKHNPDDGPTHREVWESVINHYMET